MKVNHSGEEGSCEFSSSPKTSKSDLLTVESGDKSYELSFSNFEDENGDEVEEVFFTVYKNLKNENGELEISEVIYKFHCD